MAGRPIKRTVGWFPHDADASDRSKTLTILENHFGSDGYKAWFKLLERLSTTENHLIACRNAEDFEFLAAKLKLAPERFDAIITKMADLSGIDQDLWKVDRIIWCQNLVDRLKPVYDNRKQELPHKPVVSTTEKPIPGTEKGISRTETTRRVVEVVESSREIYCHLEPIIELWRELVPSLPKPESPVKPDSARAKSIKARWREAPDVEVFRTIFAKVQASDFLSGRNGKWTSCNIDWVLKPANWQKIKEGNYDNKAVSHDRVPAGGYDETLFQ